MGNCRNPILLPTSVPSIFEFYSDPYDDTSALGNVDITTPISGNPWSYWL